MKQTVRIDGIDVEVPENVAAHIASLNNRADAAEKQNKALAQEVADGKALASKLEAERDTEKARADKAEGDLAKARADASDEARIDSAVQERLAVYDAADKAGVKIEQGMRMDDIRRKVIAAVFPTVKLDGKNADYVAACFDSAVAELAKRGDGAQRVVGADGFSGSADNYDSAKARQRMIELNERRSRGEEA